MTESPIPLPSAHTSLKRGIERSLLPEDPHKKQKVTETPETSNLPQINDQSITVTSLETSKVSSDGLQLSPARAKRRLAHQPLQVISNIHNLRRGSEKRVPKPSAKLIMD
jgi:hypothetical protein